MKRKGIAFSWKIQVSEETVTKLQTIADSIGGSVTANGVAAMAAFEIAQVRPADLWMALGAVRAFAEKGKTLPAAALPAAKQSLSR